MRGFAPSGVNDVGRNYPKFGTPPQLPAKWCPKLIILGSGDHPGMHKTKLAFGIMLGQCYIFDPDIIRPVSIFPQCHPPPYGDESLLFILFLIQWACLEIARLKKSKYWPINLLGLVRQQIQILDFFLYRFHASYSMKTLELEVVLRLVEVLLIVIFTDSMPASSTHSLSMSWTNAPSALGIWLKRTDTVDGGVLSLILFLLLFLFIYSSIQHLIYSLNIKMRIEEKDKNVKK